MRGVIPRNKPEMFFHIKCTFHQVAERTLTGSITTMICVLADIINHASLITVTLRVSDSRRVSVLALHVRKVCRPYNCSNNITVLHVISIKSRVVRK